MNAYGILVIFWPSLEEGCNLHGLREPGISLGGREIPRIKSRRVKLTEYSKPAIMEKNKNYIRRKVKKKSLKGEVSIMA